jgi:hypothetical protein
MKHHTFQEWGSHRPPAPGVDLKMCYPALRWMKSTVRPFVSKSVINTYAFDIKCT